MRQFARWILPPTAWFTFTIALIAFASGSRWWWWLFLVVLALMALAGWLERPARAHGHRKQERAQRRRWRQQQALREAERAAVRDATLIVRAEQARIRAEQMPGLDMEDKWPL